VLLVLEILFFYMLFLAVFYCVFCFVRLFKLKVAYMNNDLGVRFWS